MVNRFDDPAYAKTRQALEDIMRARPGPILDRLPEPVGMGWTTVHRAVECVPQVTTMLLRAESGVAEQHWSVRQGTEKQ
jgi:hypothetical protein